MFSLNILFLLTCQVIGVFIALSLHHVITYKNKSINWSLVTNLTRDGVVHKIHYLPSANNRSIEYFEFGSTIQQAKKILVIIPGTAMTGHFFTLYHESFKSRDVYALAISHPGQGYSEPYPTSASAKKYVETDMKPFLNGMFGNKNISVIGYSMGSSIAGYMAATMTQVENVGLLASVAPLEPFYEDEIEMNKNLFNVRLLFMHDITRRIYAYLGMNLLHYKRGNVWTSAEVLTTNSANSTIRQLFADDLFRGSALGMDGLLFAFEVMNSDWGFDFDLLSKKNVLIVSGELDDRCNKSIQFFLHQRIRNSRLVTYNGAHSDVLDKLDEYAVDLLKF